MSDANNLLPRLERSVRIVAEPPADTRVSTFSLAGPPPAPLDDEQEIVWLCDPNLLPYVRAIPYSAATRAKAPAKKQLNGTDLHQIVGYSVLSPSASSDCGRNFPRRFFALKLHDRVFEPEGTYRVGCPSESVDPLTVKPGTRGRQTERAWGGPLTHVA